MMIEDIKNKRNKLEHDIKCLVVAFEVETNATVRELNYSLIRNMDLGGKFEKVDCRIEVVASV